MNESVTNLSKVDTTCSYHTELESRFERARVRVNDAHAAEQKALASLRPGAVYKASDAAIDEVLHSRLSSALAQAHYLKLCYASDLLAHDNILQKYSEAVKNDNDEESSELGDAALHSSRRLSYKEEEIAAAMSKVHGARLARVYSENLGVNWSAAEACKMNADDWDAFASSYPTEASSFIEDHAAALAVAKGVYARAFRDAYEDEGNRADAFIERCQDRGNAADDYEIFYNQMYGAELRCEEKSRRFDLQYYPATLIARRKVLCDNADLTGCEPAEMFGSHI